MKKLYYIFVSMRPKQWTKNFVLFAGVVFSRHFISVHFIKYTLYGFLVVCVLSGAIYLLNDVIDREKDRQHPVKRKRPVASGLLSPATAVTVSLLLIVAACYFGWFLGREFFFISIAFALLNIAYSFSLKDIVILDAFSISFSFLLRAAAGVALFKPLDPSVELSPWLLICTLFLSLFLAFCKRRSEMVVLEQAEGHREALREYSINLLDQLVILSAGTALISYSIYTVWPGTVEKFGTINLVYTIPFVVFGIMRYLYLVYQKNKGQDPSGVLIMEKSILIDVFLWFLVTIIILIH